MLLFAILTEIKVFSVPPFFSSVSFKSIATCCILWGLNGLLVIASASEMIDATQVRLLPGSPFYDRQELHRKGYLAAIEPDKLLFEYRKLAKLPQPAGVTQGYSGWDSGFVRGYLAGHYLSAASRMAAATGDNSFKEKAERVVCELAKCQEALGKDGYLAAFPIDPFDLLEGKNGEASEIVVPYYTIHKIMAGLLDAHHYLHNQQALDVAVKMANYFETRLAGLKPEEIDKMLRTDRNRNPLNEFGAMSDVLAQLYAITKDRRHLQAAEVFNRSWFVIPLANGEDHLAGLHANTHIAQAVGLAHCANLTNDPAEIKASANFWKFVTSEHSFVIGGNSFKEWFDKAGVETGPSIHDHQVLPATTAESCNTHNMLKLTSHLFERDPRPEYADYYERALYNHILATVAPDTGAMAYFTPLQGNFRTYLDGNFCCVGTGIENTPRYNEGIYFQQTRSLWINLYIPSVLNWSAGEMELQQEGDFAAGMPVCFTVLRSAAKKPVVIQFRIPCWVSGPVVLSVNGHKQVSTAAPSTYLCLNRVWKTGDVVTLNLPASLRLERAKDSTSLVSVFYGPVLLAGELGRDNMPKDFADKDANLSVPPVPVPVIAVASTNPVDWLQAVPGSMLVFKTYNAGLATDIIFRPFYELHHQRYSVYWPLQTLETSTETGGFPHK